MRNCDVGDAQCLIATATRQVQTDDSRMVHRMVASWSRSGQGAGRACRGPRGRRLGRASARLSVYVLEGSTYVP